jgi:tetratricopeptide (TPR) repeat protein
LEEEGDLDAAIAVLTDAIDRLPTEPWLTARRGRLFRIRKEWRKAISDFDAALAIKPDAPTTLFFRGTCRAELGDFDGAIADLERCIQIQPRAADAYWEIAAIHDFRGSLGAAISSYRKAFELDPERYPGLKELLAELERKIDDGEGAISEALEYASDAQRNAQKAGGGDVTSERARMTEHAVDRRLSEFGIVSRGDDDD